MPQSNLRVNKLLLAFGLWGVLSFFGEIQGQNVSEEKLQSTQVIYKEKANKIIQLIALGDDYFEKHLFAEALLQYQQALKISQALGYNAYIVDCFSKISSTYQALQQYPKAIQYAQHGVRWTKVTGKLSVSGIFYLQIAINYRLSGDLHHSSNYFVKAFETGQKHQDTLLQAKAYNGLGELAAELKNESEALSYYQKALTLYQNTQNKEGLAEVLSNFAVYYLRQKAYSQALVYFLRILTLREELQDKEGLANTLNEIGNTYAMLKDFKTALLYYQKAFKLQKETQYPAGIASTANNLAAMLLEQNKLDSAEYYLHQALEIATKISNPEITLNAYQSFTKLYEKQRKFEKAYIFLQRYTDLKDSLVQEQRLKSLQNANKRLARVVEEKESQEVQRNQLLSQKSNEINQLKIANRQNAIYALIIVIGLGISLLIVLYNRYRVREKNTQELSRQVKERTTSLEKITRKLSKTNQDLDTFLYKASHDLKGPLASLEGLANLGYLESSGTNIQEFFQRQKDILRNMELKLFKIIEIGEIRNHTVKRSTIRAFHYVKRIIRSMNRVENYKQANFEVEMDKNMNIYTDLEMLDIALDNVLRNALQHSLSFYKSTPLQIQINAFENEERWEIHITDNGQGIERDLEDKIFQMFFKGSNAFQSFGLGLYKAKIAMDKLGGDVILLENKPYEKTVFAILIPKSAPPVFAL